MVLLISYDLNKHERPTAYDDVKKMIEKNAISAKKPLYSQWFVETDDTADVWYDLMKQVTDDDDNFFIVKVTRPYKGWMSKSIWPWLRERI